MRKQAAQGRKAAPTTSAKLADRPAAAAAPAAADAWSIPAVQHHGSVCTDAAHQVECMDMTAYPAAPASPASEPAMEGSACSATAAAAACPLPTLDLEITAEEAQWLVQPPALSESPTPTTNQPAACSSSQQATPTAYRPAAASLAALRSTLRRSLRRLRRRLAAAACMARPATLECGGCPGRRLGNASSGASAEWTVVHVNWS
ncbi:hypothetical protein C2E21_4431 [Chlorella sorokiniana]|uniref:Uncharacterized protein n=1 Tax=Chlorella sorokiniana TaxID=3076 RepID=A0A2P6TR17_CHLSO|nr:hypothetical protein C2E21_4431 [Chlorella sorokiniana]|eukprot:PRW56508.1 hypothetical protein C2E21_4431 [Chlorella sorokiniana]